LFKGVRNIKESRELIAVITAAVMAMSEGKANFVIRSIRRTSKGLSNWVLSGWFK